MPETAFENAPLADYRDAKNVSKQIEKHVDTHSYCIKATECFGSGHDIECPKFEDNSHAPSEPI